MAQTLSMGKCANLNFPPVGGLFQFHLERAGIGANRHSLPPEKDPVRSNLSPFHSAASRIFPRFNCHQLLSTFEPATHFTSGGFTPFSLS